MQIAMLVLSSVQTFLVLSIYGRMTARDKSIEDLKRTLRS